jgi:pyruvate/2-oxoglutarate dehydrogenase complex dihydrolipoamide acyltransferase (E2) component
MHQAAWVVDGRVVPRTVMTFFATMDHRALDAGEPFSIFSSLKEYLKHPERIYEWVSDECG